MMKKLLCVLLAALMLVGTLASCGTSNENTDTTAAGDVFTAAMVYVYLQNGNILSAVKYATCAAAISVTRPGASSSIPTRAEVIAYARKKKAEEAGEAVSEEKPEETSGDEEMNEI